MFKCMVAYAQIVEQIHTERGSPTIMTWISGTNFVWPDHMCDWLVAASLREKQKIPSMSEAV